MSRKVNNISAHSTYGNFRAEGKERSREDGRKWELICAQAKRPPD